MISYIIKTILFQLIFLISYDIFHKKDTFFTTNRVYLLITSLLSLILPFVKLKTIQERIPQEYAVNFPSVLIDQPEQVSAVIEINKNITPEVALFDTINWWIVLYCAGVCIVLYRFLVRLIKLNRIRKTTTFNSIGKYTVHNIPESRDAFSFWKTIYLGERIQKKEKEQILTHEIVHLEQLHTADHLWFEFLKIAFWFNPLIYLYQSKITTLHEYIADHTSVNILGKKQYYQQLLNVVFDTEGVRFTNQFFKKSLIKKRILMLQKSKSKNTAKMKYLFIIPCLSLMLIFTAFSNINEGFDTEKTINTTDNSAPDNEPKTKIESTNVAPFTSEKETLSSNRKIEHTAPIVQKSETKIPFAVIEKVPLTPNCTDFSTNETAKKCVSEEIKQFVNKNFDIKIAEKYGLTGINRVYVRFTIDNKGNIVDIAARAPISSLEKEAIRVIKLLPKMTPGEHKGEKVNVLYSLPIVFNIEEKKTDNIITNAKPLTEKFKKFTSEENACLNIDSQSQPDLDNYLKIKTENHAVIVDLVKTSNQKTVRKAIISKNTTYYLRNIPEDIYTINVSYGEGYEEKTVNGECKSAFTKEIKYEKGPEELNFNTITTPDGRFNVPSYTILLTVNVQAKNSKKTPQEPETVLTEKLSDLENHNIENGYYLITGIFKRKSYFNKGMATLKKEGLQPKYFQNPKDNYLYLDKYQTLGEAKNQLLSDFDGKYDGDMYILKIE